MQGLSAQADALDSIVRFLHEQLPPGAILIEHDAALLQGGGRIDTWITQNSGTREQYLGSLFPLKECSHLREVMYVPGCGTWWSMKITVWADGHSQCRFNYDDEPDYGITPPGGIQYISDQHYFPIDDDKQPEWLKKHLAEGVAELKKYGKKSYPEWLVEEIAAGNKPAWL